MENYFRYDLKKEATESFSSLNVSDIARQADPGAIAQLVELVAAAAVTCPERAEYVGRIMQMTPDSQMQMKGIIEQSLARLSDYEPSDDEEDEDDQEGVDAENELVFGDDDDGKGDGVDANDRHVFAAGHNRSAPAASAADLLEKEKLEKELADVKRELSGLKSQASNLSEDHGQSQKKLKALVEDLQDRLVKRQDELIDTEEELRTATSELSDLKSKVLDLEETKAQLADELDVSNARVEQLRKAEATMMAYRKKLESVGAMNQQMTDLEDQAANYLRQIMDLETEVKKSASLQKTIDNLNKKVETLEKDKVDSSDSVKTSVSEIADLKNKLTAAESAKKMYEGELAELRAQQNNSSTLSEDDAALAGIDGFSPLTDASSMADAKEKTMRLQIENKKLKEELGKLQTGGAVAASASVGAASGDTAALQQEIDRLKEELAKKEKENAKIGSDKDKLETYTKRTLAKFQDKYLVALQECKAKLREKQDKIEALENRSASEKTAQKREERLLSSTIYELGLAIMQNRLKER